MSAKRQESRRKQREHGKVTQSIGGSYVSPIKKPKMTRAEKRKFMEQFGGAGLLPMMAAMAYGGRTGAESTAEEREEVE